MLHCAQTRVERGEGKEMLGKKRESWGERKETEIKIHKDKKKQRDQKVMQEGLRKKGLLRR